MKPDNWFLMNRPMELVPYMLKAGFVQETDPISQGTKAIIYFEHPDYEYLIEVQTDEHYHVAYSFWLKDGMTGIAYDKVQQTMRYDYATLLFHLNWIEPLEYAMLIIHVL